jgi:hypothetical protein
MAQITITRRNVLGFTTLTLLGVSPGLRQCNHSRSVSEARAIAKDA